MEPLPWSFYRHQWTSYPGPKPGPHLQGQTVIITGPNSGLGLEALHQFTKFSPAHLILASRSLPATQAIADQLQAQYPDIRFDVWEFDAERYDTVKAFAARAEKELDKVDLVMNNAGINPGFAPSDPRSTPDQHERTIQVNVFTPLLFTLLLRPLLVKSEHPRVIFTGSDGHHYADSDPFDKALKAGEPFLQLMDDPERFSNGKRYFQSKLLLQMTTRSLISALPDMTIINANPGACVTNLGREMKLSFNLATLKMVPAMLFNVRSVKKGAWNLTGAAISDSGSHDYWSEGGPSSSENAWLTSGNGFRATKKWWDEAKAEMEKVSPGSTAGLVN